MVFNEPLNLQEILVNYFAGTLEIFFFIALAGFAFAAAKFRMPNMVFVILMGLFVIVMANYFPLLYTLTIFVFGLFLYYTIAKLIKN